MPGYCPMPNAGIIRGMRLLVTILAAAAAVAAAGVDPGPLPEDEPLASQPARGDVRGVILPPGKVTAIAAVNRATTTRHKSDRFDAATGEFLFRNLPGDTSYDLCLTLDGGADPAPARLEGIDLAWHEARMLRLERLRRRQLSMPVEATRPFERADADELLKYARDLKDFCDLRRVLYVRCDDGLRAAMLVEPMRAREFHASRDNELVWRMELWYFRWRYGGWERVPGAERVIERRRIRHDEWSRITLVFDPALSVYVDERGQSQPVRYTVSELDRSRGRVAGTELELPASSHVVGLSTTKAAR